MSVITPMWWSDLHLGAWDFSAFGLATGAPEPSWRVRCICAADVRSQNVSIHKCSYADFPSHISSVVEIIEFAENEMTAPEVPYRLGSICTAGLEMKRLKGLLMPR